jgi:hypothetical protein
MELYAIIDSCEFLFLKQIEELDYNGLRLVLEEGIASPEVVSIKLANTELTGCRRVKATNSSRIFEVVWKLYVAYAVRNESYARNNEYDVSTGGRLRIYSKSRFLDFIGHATFVSEGYPGPVQHIGIGCEDHIIDIASVDAPTVTHVWPLSS